MLCVNVHHIKSLYLYDFHNIKQFLVNLWTGYKTVEESIFALDKEFNLKNIFRDLYFFRDKKHSEN
ncbi:hypothetical protein VCHA29O37_160053 [Vibrio chagasii]|nr:hypothetical protein VCHA29O37_160053 [Vibrio chagasii]